MFKSSISLMIKATYPEPLTMDDWKLLNGWVSLALAGCPHLFLASNHVPEVFPQPSENTEPYLGTILADKANPPRIQK